MGLVNFWQMFGLTYADCLNFVVGLWLFGFFFFFFWVGLRMPRMLGGQVNFFWAQNQLRHRFTQITITPPVITQSNSNRESMVP